jgi:hypothetical protein
MPARLCHLACPLLSVNSTTGADLGAFCQISCRHACLSALRRRAVSHIEQLCFSRLVQAGAQDDHRASRRRPRGPNGASFRAIPHQLNRQCGAAVPRSVRCSLPSMMRNSRLRAITCRSCSIDFGTPARGDSSGSVPDSHSNLGRQVLGRQVVLDAWRSLARRAAVEPCSARGGVSSSPRLRVYGHRLSG